MIEQKTPELKIESKILPTERPQIDLQGLALTPEEWLPKEEEITPEMKDQLIAALITHAGKLDAPPRFTTVYEAYRYFKVISDAQIIRINKTVEDVKKRLAPKETEPKVRS